MHKFENFLILLFSFIFFCHFAVGDFAIYVCFLFKRGRGLLVAASSIFFFIAQMLPAEEVSHL